MQNILKLTNQQRQFLASVDKRGFSNPSQYYLDLDAKTKAAMRLLTKLADPSLSVGDKNNVTNKDVILPSEKYENMLPIGDIVNLLHTLISGSNRSTKNKVRVQDIYGARLAAECLQICINKLIHEYGLAIESQMSAEDNKRVVVGAGTRKIYVKTFDEKAKELILWSGAVMQEIGANSDSVETKK